MIKKCKFIGRVTLFLSFIKRITVLSDHKIWMLGKLVRKKETE